MDAQVSRFPDKKGQSIVIIGAGPAGLTAAYTLTKLAPAKTPVVYEASSMIGGISRTESHNGYRFDIGGHRFFSKVTEVVAMWQDVLGKDLLQVPRLSRIYYLGKFFDYPLRLANAFHNLGPYESFRIMLSYARWQIRPYPREDNMAEWIINRFGERLYMHFFSSYTRKVWGVSAWDIRADWAAQRIKSLTLRKAIWNALTGRNDTTSLIGKFDYPRLGPGMMWERTASLVEAAGGQVKLNSRVTKVKRDDLHVMAMTIHTAKGQMDVKGEHFISSMPLTELVLAMDPPAPPEVQEAARGLKYRDFLIVALILNHADPFPDNWIYIHAPNVEVGRIQNFRAWSAEMVPDPNHASIGMEYFCNEGDALWSRADSELIALATDELAKIGLAPASSVIDGKVIRQRKAYPVYDDGYQAKIEVIRRWLSQFDNLSTIGRNGMHRYNNQDHSMLAGMMAVRNLMGEKHDLWDINTERSYHEEFSTPGNVSKPAAA